MSEVLASTEVPVCIIGCGPIGLTGALLLARHGVPSVIVERRSELNTHPRSRFVDTNTMELFRELGIEKEVESTGLGPAWTEFLRWSETLAEEPYAVAPSPTFFSVPGPNSPCIPVMTVQDEVENALMRAVRKRPEIDVRFDTEAVGIEESDDGTLVRLRHTVSGEESAIAAQYTLGTDGPGSSTRHVIGATLDAQPRPIHSQDVIFHADLDQYVGDRKASLLYAATPLGLVIFQPLDGRLRWRCQIMVGGPELISEDEVADRIRAALGTDDDVGFEIVSMRMWQPTPGCCDTFGSGRVFLAGDAAHISVPTGGMGNNTGFAGIRNLAWKLAWVVRGLAHPSILDTYEQEHRPMTLDRIAYGVETTDHMGRMIIGQRQGLDVSEHIAEVQRYADYDHVILGYRLASALIAAVEPDSGHDQHSGGRYEPTVGPGRRAPHVWVDEAERESVLDWFGRDYVLLLGPDCDAAPWTTAGGRDLPLTVRTLPGNRSVDPYLRDGAVLVRPDAVIAVSGRACDLDPDSVFAFLPR